MSDFFKLWILHTKQAHKLGLEYHQKYGHIVRAAPNLLAVDHPMLLPQIYHRRVDKTDVYTVGVLGEIAPPFQTPPGLPRPVKSWISQLGHSE